MLIFDNQEPETPFAPPKYQYYIYEEDVNDIVSVSKLETIIKEKAVDIIKTTPPLGDGQTGLGPHSLTSRFMNYNLLQWKEIPEIKEAITKVVYNFLDKINKPQDFIYGVSWANIMEKGKHIKEHRHACNQDCYLGAHLSVKTNQTSTVYINPITGTHEIIPNKEGYLTIFSNWIPHYTTNVIDKERITIAMDLIPDYIFHRYQKGTAWESRWEKIN